MSLAGDERQLCAAMSAAIVSATSVVLERHTSLSKRLLEEDCLFCLLNVTGDVTSECVTPSLSILHDCTALLMSDTPLHGHLLRPTLQYLHLSVAS